MKYTWSLAVCCVWALLAVGLVSLCSATMNQLEADYFERQLQWVLIGVVAMGIGVCLDYRWLQQWRLPWVLYGLALGLLVLVLIPGVGSQINGARRWLFGTQPSEIAKLAYIIGLAHWCSSRANQMRRRNEGFLYPAGGMGVMILLIFAEPDWGTAMLLAAVGAMFLLLARSPRAWLGAGAVIGLELLVLALCHNEHRLERVLVFRDPEAFREQMGWQPWNSLLALGSGGWHGLGLGEGRMKLGFIPEHQTDFLLAVMGEEWGFLGTTFVIVVFMTFIVCGLRIAWRAPDGFGQYLAAGITFLIGLQAFINIGVVTSSLPNKGIPLPFISYGGSSLVATLFAVGLLLSVGRRIPEAKPIPKPAPNREPCASVPEQCWSI